MDSMSLIILVVIIVLILAVYIVAKKQFALQRDLIDSQARIGQLMNELKALYAGAAGQSNHIARMEEKISTLSDKQEQLGAQDPTTQSYSDAIELIQAGASIEELVRHGLRREEAELLMRLHGEQSLG